MRSWRSNEVAEELRGRRRGRRLVVRSWLVCRSDGEVVIELGFGDRCKEEEGLGVGIGFNLN